MKTPGSSRLLVLPQDRVLEESHTSLPLISSDQSFWDVFVALSYKKSLVCSPEAVKLPLPFPSLHNLIAKKSHLLYHTKILHILQGVDRVLLLSNNI